MSELHTVDGADPIGPPPPPPPGPIAQSVAIGFRTVYIAGLLLLVLWLTSNVREIASDTQAVVLRFGRIVRSQEAGLLVAWPRPIEQVQLLPGPERQLTQEIAPLPPASEQSLLLTGPFGANQPIPQNAAGYLTGDGNVVLLNATLFYRISDPVSYSLSQAHVPAALNRLFRATTVRVTAARNLNDFLVVQTGTDAGDQTVLALRGEVRSSLIQSMNDRLHALAEGGASLGVEIERIDMTAWLPPQAKAAFDAVLVATQAADRGVAIARTDAEHRRQEADRLRDQLLADAQATAQELVSGANVNTAGILALEHEETPQTRGSLLWREYRVKVGEIMNHVGSATLVDSQGGTRVVLPGSPRTMSGAHHMFSAAPADGRPLLLLERAERILLGLRLSLALAALCLLIVAFGMHWLVPSEQGIAELVAGIAAALVAVPVFVEAWASLRHPSLHGITDRLVALALIAAWATGDLMTAALLPIIMTVGHVLEERSMLGSQEAVRALGRLTEVDSRRLLPDGTTEVVPSAELRVGDRIELLAGDRVPADGIVRRGSSSLDLASLTGESVPVEVQEGDQALAGAMNVDGRLQIELTRVGRESTVGRIIALMREAENAKPPVTRLLDRYAGQYMALVLLVAGGTWLITANVPAMLAVLVASCPCALVLAAPATAVAAIAVAARHGILIKGSAFLEHLADVSSVVFDKTGTLTTGDLRLSDALPVTGTDADELRRLGASLGAASNHPLSRAAAAAVPEAEQLRVEETRELGGFGVTGLLGKEPVALGRADLFLRLGVAAPAPPTHNGPIAGVSRGGRFLGWLLFQDQLRGSATTAVEDLKGLGIEHMVLLTGDRTAVARQVATEVGIEEVWAEMLPEQKMDRVMHEIKLGHRPMVVGDGINDSLALRAGAVGVAMGTQGAEVAFASADLALMTNDLRRLGTCIRLSRRCRRTIYVNVTIGLAFTFGLIVLSGAGVLGLEAPIIAALLHNVSTFIGIANAGRLLLFDETLSQAPADVAA